MNNLEHITTFGSNGTGNEQLQAPFGMAADDNYLYICDSINDRVLKWTLAGGQFVAKNDSDWDNPDGIVIHKDVLFVSDRLNDQIQILRKSDLKTIKKFGDGDLVGPRGLANNGEFLWVVDRTNDRIVKYDIETLEIVETGGSNGSGDTNLNGPWQMAYDKHENVIYIVDQGNLRVMKWDANGFAYRDKIIQSDSTDGSLLGITGVAVKDHYVYLLETSRVQVFDTATLTTQDSAGTDGTGRGNIDDGNYLLAHEDVLFIAEDDNDRISIWSNYEPYRETSPRKTRTIGGFRFDNPHVTIGGQQEGAAITIGGTNASDLHLWQAEKPEANRFGWTKE